MTAKRMTEDRRTKDTSPINAFLSLPGLQISQRVALEAARFSARRMRAFADQMEALASCDSPTEFFAVQSQFLQRMQKDYTAEREAVANIVSSAQEEAERAV